jgi:hypothetical protein
MPEDPNVEKLLAEQKALENRKRALIDDVLRQKVEPVKSFDEQLAKLRYHDNGAKPRRSHRKKGAPSATPVKAPEAAKNPKAKS